MDSTYRGGGRMTVLKSYNEDSEQWETIVVGKQGPSGVVAVTAPITNTGTSTEANIGIDQASLTLAQSQVTGLESDLAAIVANYLLSTHQPSDSIEVLLRHTSNITNVTISAGIAYLTYFTPVITKTVSEITMRSQATAGASLTLARMGIYSFNSDGDATLVARTANDTTLFTNTNTIYTRSFDTADGYPATYQLVAGQRYAISQIVTGTTMPTFSGLTANGTIGALEPRMMGGRGSQTDLPDTITSAQIGGVPTIYWGRLS
jgi:hypothetical protein